jgi:3-deoxy-D-manno-octulosonic-acid transferase
MIYLAGALPSLGGAVMFFGVVTLFLCAVSIFVRAVMYDKIITPQKRYVALGVALIFMANLIPSERTMIMIAASEVGEMVVTDQRVDKLLDKSVQVLENKLNKYLEEDAKDDKSGGTDT